ncbi:MAG: ATP phosphoribosyltransferase regulatory subunit [Sphingomonadaceae bacterium]|uniref:ATP phosphoribosyltransferase regulatory subunit n=1 Tax=Thermaurantiacus sp. TaxID=2820283 RepID=UPI00298EEAA5|nr:ATP phosphoribosyltransferase regulatory subunit [Thermaurantiacus sp.]MCS6986820.1 ATP phosphoribosyltransferase regulatory subunit [Sphingomonadaceae bacterium]MDW8413917.1 ATP phosphoribosyltransferase regulatory subunit [Thermaurantiacus sp.]
MAPALLPEGFRDRLPPEAGRRARLLDRILGVISAHGYERVEPPLVEFEESLTRWLASAAADGLIRASDPASGRALVLRPDITGQIARIAATRLAEAPRPLRLAYGGRVLRARGTELDPARERTQAGAELVGADSPHAVAEVVMVALEALEACGVEAVSVDLTLPDLVPRLAAGPWPVAQGADVARALDMRDLSALDAPDRRPYRALLEVPGEAGPALSRLRALDLPPPFPALFDRLEAVVRAVPRARVTIDPCERHGFAYHSWVGFTLFGTARGRPFRTEVGRGGAYVILRPDGREEPASGFSLYVDPLAEAGLGDAPAPRLFLPLGTPEAVARGLRAEGWCTVAALTEADDARALGCTHRWQDGRVVEAG